MLAVLAEAGAVTAAQVVPLLRVQGCYCSLPLPQGREFRLSFCLSVLVVVVNGRGRENTRKIGLKPEQELQHGSDE